MTYSVGSFAVIRADAAAHLAPRASRWALAAVLLVVIGAGSVALSYGLIDVPGMTAAIAGACAVAAVVVILHILWSPKTTPVERGGVRRYLLVFLASLVQVTLFTQIFTVLIIYAQGRSETGAAALQLGIVLGPLSSAVGSLGEVMSEVKTVRS